jgi:hypothetical protein
MVCVKPGVPTYTPNRGSAEFLRSRTANVQNLTCLVTPICFTLIWLLCSRSTHLILKLHSRIFHDIPPRPTLGGRGRVVEEWLLSEKPHKAGGLGRGVDVPSIPRFSLVRFKQFEPSFWPIHQTLPSQTSIAEEQDSCFGSCQGVNVWVRLRIYGSTL